MEKRSLPGSLVAVGVLFILSGISAALEMLHALANNWFYINFGVIGLFVGWGLLKLRPGWRIAALVLLVIGMIVTAIVAAIFLGMGFSGAGPLDFRAGGKLVGHVPAFLGVVVAVAVFALCYWQYRVLRSAEIRELFDVEVSPREARRMHRDQGRGQERGSHEA